MDEWMEGWMDGCMDVCMYGWMEGQMNLLFLTDSFEREVALPVVPLPIVVHHCAVLTGPEVVWLGFLPVTVVQGSANSATERGLVSEHTQTHTHTHTHTQT